MRKRILPYGAIKDAASFGGVTRDYASRVAHGVHDWRKARAALIRALYNVGWSPAEGRAKVRHWLNLKAAIGKAEADDLKVDS